MPKLMMMPPQNERTLEWAERLDQNLPDYQIIAPENEEAVRREIVDTDAVYGRVLPELLPLAEKLRWLQSSAIAPPAGYYYPELIEHPLVVTNPRGTFNDHIGQHILMFVLALSRGLPFYMHAQFNRQWTKNVQPTPGASDQPQLNEYVPLGDATALIVGVGGIGREAARLCTAVGMRVLGVDARWEEDVPGVDKHGPDELDALLPQADFVIVTAPHTPQTEGMWHAERFARMKSTAYFINIGRGKTTRLEDLTAAIANGTIAGCGLDVYEVEPLPSDHRLWTLPNVVLTPHIAGMEAANIRERQYQILLENARRFAAGEPLQNVVDKTLWY